MSTRQEKHDDAMRRAYLANTQLILDYCLRKRMSQEDVLYFSSRIISYDDFRWFYKRARGRVDVLKGMLQRRQEKIDRNRNQGYSYLPPEAL